MIEFQLFKLVIYINKCLDSILFFIYYLCFYIPVVFVRINYIFIDQNHIIKFILTFCAIETVKLLTYRIFFPEPSRSRGCYTTIRNGLFIKHNNNFSQISAD